MSKAGGKKQGSTIAVTENWLRIARAHWEALQEAGEPPSFAAEAKRIGVTKSALHRAISLGQVTTVVARALAQHWRLAYPQAQISTPDEERWLRAGQALLAAGSPAFQNLLSLAESAADTAAQTILEEIDQMTPDENHNHLSPPPISPARRRTKH